MTTLYQLTLKCFAGYLLVVAVLLCLSSLSHAQVTYITEDGIVRSSPQDPVERYYTDVTGTFEIPVADVIYVTLTGPTVFSFSSSWRTNHVEDLRLFVYDGDVHAPDYSAITFGAAPTIDAENIFYIYRPSGVAETWRGIQLDVLAGGGGGGNPEGSAVLSTAETGGKVLTADGDGSSSWQDAGGSGFLSVAADLTAIADYDITVPDPYLLTQAIVYAGGTTVNLDYQVGTPASATLVTDNSPGQIETALRISDIHVITGGTVRLKVLVADTGGNTSGKLIIAGTEL